MTQTDDLSDSPSLLNQSVRLFLIAKYHGSHFLDNAESFDRMLGCRGRFAQLDSRVLGIVRGAVESSANQSTHTVV